MCDDDDGGFVVIKDLYLDDRRRFQEGALLEHIHNSGIFPGVVRVIALDEVLDSNRLPVTTARLAADIVECRTKKRLIIGSRGSRLSNAGSAKELLVAVHDGVEGESTSDLSYHAVLITFLS